jgi:alanine dehydrogenase
MEHPVFLTSEEVRGLAEPAEFVDAVQDAYRQRGEGAAAKPRTTLGSTDPPGMLTGYTAILPETGVMGGYTYSAGFEAADAWFVTPLFDARTGEPLAILDGAWMNPYKTGAAGAVAVDALAREDAEVVAIIGSGAQARGQLRALATVRDVSEIRVYSRTPEHRESFALEFDDRLDVDVSAVSNSERAVRGADVVVTATNADEPVIDGDHLDDGTHVTAMGQYHPKKRELDHATIERSVYVPDLRDRIHQDAGAFRSAMAAGVVDDSHVHGELGDVVAGTAEGRIADDQITVFDSGGTGIETVAGANLLYERARERGRGSEIELSPASESLTGR